MGQFKINILTVFGYWLIFQLFFLCPTSINSSNECGNRERNIFREDGSKMKERSMVKVNTIWSPFTLPPGYDKMIIPSERYALLRNDSTSTKLSDGTAKSDIQINITMRVIEVADVSEQDEEITFSADLMVSWVDSVISMHTELKYKNSPSPYHGDEPIFRDLDTDSDAAQKIWKPDLFISHLVKVSHPEIMRQPLSLRINEVTGEVIFLARLRVKILCDMDFSYYPADTQTCYVSIRSNSRPNDEIKLKWAECYGAFLESINDPNYNLQLVEVKQSVMKHRYIHRTVREYSVLSFQLKARRKLSYHLVQTFLPSMFYIIITWLCFLVPSHMVEARIGISMTTVLTLTAMFASVRENTPHVSYVRAIDIWMIVCIFFVFLTLLEFTVLLWLRNMKQETEVAASSPQVEAIVDPPEMVRNRSNALTKKLSRIETFGLKLTLSHRNRRRQYSWKRQAKALSNTSEFIEKYAFIIFSTMFTIFAIIYWSWLLIGSGYYEWERDCCINNCEGKQLKDDQEPEDAYCPA